MTRSRKRKRLFQAFLNSMEISILSQSLCILKFVLVGIYFALIFDGFKILKNIFSDEYREKTIKKLSQKSFKRIKNPLERPKNSKRIKNLIICELINFIYFLFITPQMAIFVFGFNKGEVRWYIFLGLLTGAFIYKITLGRLFTFIIEYTSFYIKVLSLYIVYLIKKPLKKLKGKLKPKIKKRHKTDKKENNRKVIYQISYKKA